MKKRYLINALKLLVVLLVCKVVATTFVNFRDYFPPRFDDGFLLGRQGYFFGGYQWAFYVHVVAGPASLLMGMVLLSSRFRRRFTKLHRVIGRAQVACVLLLVVPSGLAMAFHANSGAVAGVGFAALALATGVAIVCGWRAAVQRRFGVHRQWMNRCFMLLCSAIVIRAIGGFVETFGLEAAWVYPVSAWACWVLPLVVLELVELASLKRATDAHGSSRLGW